VFAGGDSEADISPAILLGDAQATPGLFGPGKKDVVTVQGKKSGDAPQRISISVDSGSECATPLNHPDGPPYQ
jgi:hypothetical protein